MENFRYEERLNTWGLTTLRERRTRGDLIQLYKAQHGLEIINWPAGPHKAPMSQTRSAQSNSLRFIRDNFSSRAKNDYGHHVTTRHEFFTNRVVGSLNSLLDSVVSAPSLNSFKTRLDNIPGKAAIAH